MELAAKIGQKLLLAFAGKDKPSENIVQALRQYQASGITLFRSLNIDNPVQVRQLTGQLQELARELSLPPLLIAADQEGGQLMAIGGGTTLLPGNMALGATGSVDLARRAGEVLGRELAAMGINVNYAPCVDVNINPFNPVVGVRSFGENPEKVAKLAAAMVDGIQAQRVAATAKHFPGHGDTESDSHHGLPSVAHNLTRLQNVEFPPFRGSIQAGVKLIMSAHLALPSVDGADAPPATLSANILKHLLRRQLGFEGLIVTDAMDMHAIRQGEYLGEDAVRAVNAGADLLLLTSNPLDQQRIHHALIHAAVENRLDLEDVNASAKRIAALKAWLFESTSMPEISVVGCAEHQRVAREIAEQSVTLVREKAKLLPLHLTPDQKITVVIPKPQDLTPADTSSYIVPELADAIRHYHPNVAEFIVPYAPGDMDIAAVVQRVTGSDLVIIGTLNAYHRPGQQALVSEVLKSGIPTVVAALRLPYDLAAFPQAATFVCTYSIQQPSIQSLAKALFGQIDFKGRLPVAIPGLYEAEHHYTG